MSDLTGALLTIGWVLIFLVFTELFSRTGKISKESARKIIHISVGHVIFFVPLFDTKWIAAGIPLMFTFGNYLLSPNSPFEKLRLETFKAGHAWGTVLYPLSLAIVTYIGFYHPLIIIAAFFPVVYGDGLAAIIGPKYPIKKFNLYNGTKSIGGTLTVFLASFISVSIGSFLMDAFHNFFVFYLGPFLFFVFLVSVIATLVEFFSPKGTDNFFIPVVLIGILLL